MLPVSIMFIIINGRIIYIDNNPMIEERMKFSSEQARFYQKIHRVGDLYHPEDLNDARYQEQIRQRRGRPAKPDQDPFEVLDIDPLHEYKNVRLLSLFVSDMGKILPRDQTGKDDIFLYRNHGLFISICISRCQCQEPT